ncbi:hypothetical protein MRS44_004549 [Fusarium solani]|uniref:uncharacterized protein n=1 Tax=Fusarium solani TaxID=169388 RepID=UPI0032C401F4|nr:hypothetical protein MRS44_004549 [Fusarium solani]
MEYEDYDVLSYFINVGAGDSAVHILRQRDPPGVEAAVLIDGGRSTSVGSVEGAIASIRAEFNSKFPFTSIVVTHWDADHYAGLMKLLYNQWKTPKLPPYINSNITTFYCPWKDVKALGSINDNMKVGLDEKKACYWLFFRLSSTSEWRPVCRAVVSTYAMGHDLFTSLKPSENTLTKPSMWPFMWPSSLSQVYSNAPNLVAFKKPIFLVYGVDGLSFKDSIDQWSAPSAPTKLSKNDSSIMALVIWPEPVATEPMRVSLYTGGDVEQDPMEDELVKWLVDGPRKLKLDVVKASHHGSHYSTSEKLLMQKLQYLVISAGNQFGHPSFAVVYCFLALAYLAQLRNAQQGKDSHPVMVCTRHPYWLTRHPRSVIATDCNPATVMGWGLSALAIHRDFRKINQPTDNNFLPTFLKENYKDAFPSATAYAYLSFFSDKTMTEQDFNKAVDEDKDHPLLEELNQMVNPLPEKGEVYLERTIEKIQRSTQTKVQGFLEPGSDDFREVQWIMLMASGNRPEIVRPVRRAIGDSVTKQVADAAETFTDEGNRGSMEIESDASPKTNATHWHFSPVVADTNKLPSGFDNPHKQRKPNAAVVSMKPTAAPPGFSSVEEWIASILLRGLLDEKLSLEAAFDEVLAPTKSACARWLGECFNSSASLRLAGTRDQEKVLLKRADILLTPSGDSSALSFTTNGAARISQFGPEAETHQTLRGFDANIEGLAKLVNFPLSGNILVSKHLGNLELSGYEGSRSGIWFIPQFYSRTILRMALKPKDRGGIDDLEKLLGDSLGSVRFSDPVVVGTCVVERLTTKKRESLAKLGLQAGIKWGESNGSPPAFQGKASLEFSATGVELVFKLAHSENLLESLLSWAKKLMGGKSDQSLQEGEPSQPTLSDHLTTALGATGFSIHRISVGLDEKMKPRSLEISVEIDAHFPRNSATPFLITIRWNNGAFQVSGETWPVPLFGDPSSPLRLHPFYEENSLTIPTAPDPVYEIPIESLLHLPEGAHIPPGLPDKVTEFRAMMSLGHGKTRASFSAILKCDMSKTKASGTLDETAAPLLSLDTVYLGLEVGFPPKNGKPELDIRLDAHLTLSLPPRFDSSGVPEPSQSPIDFSISRQKNSKGYEWVSSANIKQLRVARLFQLFAPDGSNRALLDVMGGIYLATASIQHRYDGGTSLDIAGKLRLGRPESGHAVELGFNYEHHADTKSWLFKAELRPEPSEAKLRVASLLSDLVDEDELPGFLRNLQVPLDKLNVDLDCSKKMDGDNNSHVIFSLIITVGEFVLTLAQLRSVEAAKLSAARVSDGRVSGTADDGPAQLIRFTLPSVRQVPHMPIVGAIEQPFDHLGIVWTNRDLTDAEVKLFNEKVFEVFDSLPLLSKNKSGAAEPILRGLHFQIGMNQGETHRLVLDHVLAKKRKKKGPKRSDNGGLQDREDLSLAESDQPSGKTITPMSKTLGPLSVSSIGLSISGQSFSNIIVSLDAALSLGPVNIKLLGLTLAINLEKVVGPDDLGDLAFVVGLGGMAVDFEKSPTRLAGMFVPFGSTKDREAGFMGAIAVSVAKWSAIAAGMYFETNPKHKTKPDPMKSLFVFGTLRGTLFTVGSFDINSLTGGFGYNSTLKLPSVSQVADFPFVAMNSKDTAPPSTLMTQLSTLREGDGGKTGWITMPSTDMWMVAGVGFKAFQTVDAQALVALTLADEPKFAVMAQATAIFPKGKSRDRAFLVLDIVISAEIDPHHGNLLVAGELTPRSFILNPSCRLTGGFACQVFLAGSPYEGDFVFTVGGYHNQYSVPSHYPVAPSRVGIKWEYDSDIYISGAAYFAITPQVAMGGGRMDLVVNKGWVRATFSAWADFFMHYHPFFFIAEVGICLWAEVNIPALLCNIHLGPKEFSARLGLQGPPMAGYVHLHFWKYDTIVAFGPMSLRPPPLSWEPFLRMVKNLPAEPRESDAKNAPNHIITITKGALPVHESARPGFQDEGSPRVEIRATHLEFQVQARVPMLSATVGQNAPFKTSSSSSLFARPMQHKEAIASSHMTVTLQHVGADAASQPKLQLQNTVMKKVAPALWGRYKDGESPSAVASEEMPEHTMVLDVCVEPHDPSNEGLPVIDVVEFSTTKLAPGKIPVVKKAEKMSVKLQTVKTETRGHAHMLNLEAVAEEDDKRAQWIKDLIRV